MIEILTFSKLVIIWIKCTEVLTVENMVIRECGI